MAAPDLLFTEAALAKLLEAEPGMAELLDHLSPEDRAQFVSRWLGTFQAHRLMLAHQFEEAGFEEFAAWLRDHPLGTA